MRFKVIAELRHEVTITIEDVILEDRDPDDVADVLWDLYADDYMPYAGKSQVDLMDLDFEEEKG